VSVDECLISGRTGKKALRASALVLARQIDEIRCSSASDLADLLAK
jgi:hypothetical protein